MRVLAVAAACVLAAVVGCATEGSGASTGESDIATKPPKAWEVSAKKAGNLRVATFNIRNFPTGVIPNADAGPEEPPQPGYVAHSATETDLAMALSVLDKLEFDVLGVQEIDDTKAFEELLARLGDKNGHRYQAVFSTEWPQPQHVGIVVRDDRARIDAPKVHGDIATRPTLRAGLSAHIVSKKAGGADFGMLVVHLASGNSAGREAIRANQASFAAKVVAERKSELGEDDFIVLGDFNTAGEEREWPNLDNVMAGSESGLSRQKNESGCTDYYTDGKNPLLQPSWLDQVYVASLTERDTSVPIVAGAHCAERSCQAFESTSAESGTSYWGVSDHCPVYFEIADQDRD